MNIDQLIAIPASTISLTFTPLLGVERQDTKDVRQGRHPDVLREMARITGRVAEYLICADVRRRERTAKIAADTGAVVDLSLNPWSLGRFRDVKKFIEVGDIEMQQDRIGGLSEYHLVNWEYSLGCLPNSIYVVDESFKLTPENRDGILDRTCQLWRALRLHGPLFVHTYNARMVREGHLFPFVHSLTPGPSSCSLYYWDNHRNGHRLANTVRLHRQLELTGGVIAHVELHRRRKERGGGDWEPIGYMPERYRELGEIIRECGVELVSIGEMPIVKDGGLNEPVVANMASLIEGMNG